ncbi:MAG: type III secretion system export apparatus subunit SctV [Pseudomonadota bacterium]
MILKHIKTFLLRIPESQDLAIAFVLVLAISLMVVPMPTVLVDVLIGFNFGIAILLLMTGIYLQTPLQLSTLPGMVLISTIFRLALSITTTRLILSEGDAGAIVRTFGEFVVAGNIVVGLVIFLVITVVQFIVIAKGSERVAEVSARFTLDALPGKQMSIDAELRNGDIDNDVAAEKRRLLERESQLYGSMDGAMKFVKGDAIAGLVITAVNLVGGFLIGTTQLGLPFSEAIHEYSLLTVGDALISQIPALLLSITAATVVTRVSSETKQNLGQDIGRQLFSDYRALLLAGATLGFMAFLPGFPTGILIGLGVVFAVASFLRKRIAAKALMDEMESAQDTDAEDIVEALPPAGKAKALLVSPDPHAVLKLVLSKDLGARITEPVMQPYLDVVKRKTEQQLGISPPDVAYALDEGLQPAMFRIDLEGVPLLTNEAPLDKLHYLDERKHLELMDIPFEPTADDIGGVWVDASHAKTLSDAGANYLNCPQIIADRLLKMIMKNASSFLGIQETRELMADLSQEYGELVGEVLRTTPVQKIADVLRRLLDERISIVNMRLILEALAEWGEKENDVILLTEYVRSSLKRQICHTHCDERHVVSGFILEQGVERAVRQAVQQTTVGGYLVLDDQSSELFCAEVRKHLARVSDRDVKTVIMTSLDIRRHIRNLLARNGLDVPVLSFQDLADGFVAQPLDTIKLKGVG